MRKDTPPSLRGERRSTWQSISFQHHRLLRPKLFCARNDKQCGNALWFILVAIGLLGLLTVMLSRSGSSTNETGSYEQNVITANEILSYAKNVENGVQNLLARGCGENELSFWHDSDGNGTEDASDNYYNTNSPTDRSCHIFDVAGAGLNYTRLNEKSYPNFPVFVNSLQIEGVGTDCTTPKCFELTMVLRLTPTGSITVNGDRAMCDAINSLLKNDSAMAETSFGDDTPGTSLYALFTGEFKTGNIIDQSIFNSKRTYCGTLNGTIYSFHHVLHAR